jgi:hypothetical protein
MEMNESFFGEGGHLNDEGTALYVDALKLNTTEQLPPHVRDHVAECLDCKKSVTELFALLDDADYGDVRSHPFFRLPRETRSPVPFILKIAAVLAGVAGLATLTYIIDPFKQGPSPGQTSQTELKGGADSAGKVQRQGLKTGAGEGADFAANFEADPELDDLVNGRTRSGAFQALSPANGSVPGPDALFSWKTDGKNPLTLTIVNNRGGVILTQSGLRSRFVLGRKLTAGLYYWKIEDDSELLFVGKFLVR